VLQTAQTPGAFFILIAGIELNVYLRFARRERRAFRAPMALLVRGGGFFFCFCRARQAVDDAVQGDAFGVRPMQIWRPTAARTFFEGQEGYCSYRKTQTEREQTRLNVALFVNIFRVFQ